MRMNEFDVRRGLTRGGLLRASAKGALFLAPQKKRRERETTGDSAGKHINFPSN